MGDVRTRYGERAAAQGGRRRLGPLGLLVLTLAVHAALPAPARAASAPTGAGTGPVGSIGRRLPHGRRSALEIRVARLTRALQLDPEQQGAVRRALQEQQQQVQQVWVAGPASAADRIAAIRHVSAGTAERIRAVLSEEQRKRFNPPAPAGPESFRSVNVEEWLQKAGH
jgi:hypothetical protein